MNGTPPEPNGLDDLARRSTADWQTPGPALAVARDSAIVFAGRYGLTPTGHRP